MTTQRICAECGSKFVPGKPWAVFCGRVCNQAFHDRSAIRGKALYPLAAVWRRGKRGRTEATAYALAEMARLLDAWAEEDAKAHRQPALVVKAKMDAGWTAADLVARRVRKMDRATSGPAQP